MNEHKKIDIDSVIDKLDSNPREAIGIMAKSGLPKVVSSETMLNIVKNVDLESLTCEEVIHLHKTYGLCFYLRAGCLKDVFLEK